VLIILSRMALCVGSDEIINSCRAGAKRVFAAKPFCGWGQTPSAPGRQTDK